MAGGTVQMALTNAASEPHHTDAQFSYYDPIHVPYENFAIESIEISPNGTSEFGRKASFKLLNHAEYICGGYLEVTFPVINAPPTDGNDQFRIAWIQNLGIHMVDQIEFKVNNNNLDVLYPEFMDMWCRLSLPEGKKKGFNDMIGQVNFYTRHSHSRYVQSDVIDPRGPQVADAEKAQFKVMLPLMFWWCMDWSQALPIGVLVFCELWIHVHFKRSSDLYIVYKTTDAGADHWLPNDDAITKELDLRAVVTPRMVDCKLYIDYIYLPTDARDRIADKQHFYFIKQCKFSGPIAAESNVLQHKLSLVLPTEDIVFAFRERHATTARAYHCFDKYHGNGGNPTDGTVLFDIPDPLVNGITLKVLATDRQTPRDWMYHSKYVPYKCNTSIPESHGVYQWNFALHPESSQASGVINFSSSEQNYLNFTFNQGAAVDGTTPSGIGIGEHTADLFLYGISSNYIYINNGYLTALYNA